VLRSRTGGLNQETVQTEVFATQGPKELKKIRITLTKGSLELAKQRLEQRREFVDHMEKNWEKHEAGTIFITGSTKTIFRVRTSKGPSEIRIRIIQLWI
jgi:hypothetical protein